MTSEATPRLLDTARRRLRDGLKSVLKSTVWRIGSTATIQTGPLKGAKFVVSEQTGWASIYNNWEPGALSVYQRYVGPGDIVYDLGANTGMHSLALSRLVGEAGAVHAFEPMGAVVAEIESLVALNNIQNVSIVQAAVSDRSGEAEFKVGAHDKQGSLVGIGRETGETVTVKVLTLDDYIDGGAAPPAFVKVDVEGAESAALRGAARCVERFRPVFSIDLHTPEEDVAVGSFFDERGYVIYRFDANVQDGASTLTKVKNLRAGWPDPDGVHGNILALPPERAV